MNRNPLAVSHRSGRIDALHYGSIAVVDTTGTVLYSVNDPHFPTYLRSSIKMIQALPVVLSGAADRFGFTEAELAICCASHAGAGYHLTTVARMLQAIGLDESALGCGVHEPDDRTERTRLVRSDHAPSQLHNNCSGKHTGMLAACLAMGWPVEGYLAIEHPLQQWILDLMAQYSGVAREQIGLGVDGCSLPAFYMPLSAAATALARFIAGARSTAPAAGLPGESLPGEGLPVDTFPAAGLPVAGLPAADVCAASKRILDAVAANPEMINDHGGFDTELVRTGGGRIIAKRGAMAIFVVGIDTPTHGPIGIAVKLEDGNMAPMSVVVMRVLDALGVVEAGGSQELDRFRRIDLANWRGLDVGDIVPIFELVGAAAV